MTYRAKCDAKKSRTGPRRARRLAAVTAALKGYTQPDTIAFYESWDLLRGVHKIERADTGEIVRREAMRLEVVYPDGPPSANQHTVMHPDDLARLYDVER